MKIRLFVFAAISVMVLPVFASAADEPTLADIIASQNISNADQLSCDKATDDQLAELGDAFMAFRHPNDAEHAFMDQLMGGEGSDSLRQAHVYMGQAYLGCGSYSGIGFGMPGQGMMAGYADVENNYAGNSWGMMGIPFGSMMGYGFGASAFGWVTMLLVWTALILGILWLVKNTNRKK